MKNSTEFQQTRKEKLISILEAVTKDEASEDINISELADIIIEDLEEKNQLEVLDKFDIVAGNVIGLIEVSMQAKNHIKEIIQAFKS